MTSRRLLDPVTRTLLDAADLIEQEGWWNGKERPIGNETCPFYAMLAVLAASHGDMATMEAAEKRLLANVHPYSSIADWNDAQAGGSVVIAVLREAAFH